MGVERKQTLLNLKRKKHERISLDARKEARQRHLRCARYFFGECQSINFKRNRAWNAVDALIKLVEIEKIAIFFDFWYLDH